MLSLGMVLPPASAPRPRAVPAPAHELEELAAPVRAAIAAVLRRGRFDPDVDDCTSETLRRAMEGRHRLRPGEPLRPWVVGIARHVALDALRARRRAAVRHVQDGDEDRLVERVPDSTPGADVALERAERATRVRRALDTLPEDQRRVLEMFHLEGLPYKVIAERLDVPIGTVCTWVSRGRRAMATALDDGVSS